MKKSNKAIFLAGAFIVCSTVAYASGEVEGYEAKSIVMNGDVLGVTLFDDFFKDVFKEKKAGFIYSVKYENEIYYCFNYNRTKWFCEK